MKNKLRLKTIGGKIILSIVIVIAICVLFSAFIVSQVVKDQLGEKYEVDKVAATESLSYSLAPVLDLYDYKQVERIITSSLTYENIAYITVFDKGGITIVSAAEQDVSSKDLDVEKYEITSNDKVIGSIEVGFSRKYIDEQIQTTTVALISGLAGFLILVGLALYIFINRSVINPLGAFTKTVREMDSENLSLRVNIHSEDELGTLAGSFNQMAEDLEKSQQTLRKQTYDIGKRIKELTCLYGISQIISMSRDNMDTILKEMLDHIANGWQYPEITCAKITLYDNDFTTSNYTDTEWKLSSDIVIKGRKQGTIDIYYLEERPNIQSGPFLKEERDLIDGIAGLLGELTERREAEESLRQMSKVFMDSSDPIVIEDLEGRVIDLNTEAEHAYGWKREELIDKPIKELVPAERHGQADELLALCKTGGEVRNIEGLRCNKSGRVFPVLMTLSLLTGEDGKTTAIASIEKDITELKQAEQKLVELNKRLKQFNLSLEQKIKERTRELEIATGEAEAANQAKSEFLANMSHELRTPLNAIIGFSQILQDEDYSNLEESERGYAKDIYESGTHLLNLINDILDLAKVESGKMELELEPVKIKHLLESSLVMIKEKAFNHGIQLVTEITSVLEDFEIMADERKLKQITFNLLSNAAKFTPDGGQITIECKKEGEQLVVSVTDTGVGIAPEEKEKVFEEFYQTRDGSKSKTTGTGLGLPLTRSFVEMHGGKIWAESGGKDKGSRFIFTIPIR